VVTVVARNENDAGGAYGGVWRSRRLAGVWSQVVGSVLVRLTGAVNVFKFNKFCTFNAICKDNAAINFITVQHKTGSYSSTYTDPTNQTNQKTN
jgi:hypothetical protein